MLTWMSTVRSASAHVEVLLLQHESLPDAEQDTYLASVLWPARVLVCVGRSAALEPRCDRNEAVYWWWKEPLEHTIVAWVCCRRLG